LALGLLISNLQGAGYAVRYSAPAVVPVLLAAAVGIASLGRRPAAVAGITVGFLSLGVCQFSTLLDDRTQARTTATLIESRLRPGDLVVYCPDQLGPAIDRLLPPDTAEVVYPTMGSPELVDWVDYAARNAAASPSAFAAVVNQRTTGAIWLIRGDNYRTFGTQCAELDYDIAELRGNRTVARAPTAGTDAQWILRYETGDA
jgi:hypothetical protein